VIIAFTITKKNNTKQHIKTQKVVSRSGMKNAKYSGSMFTISNSNNNASDGHNINDIASDFLEDDYLGKAAEAGNNAKIAVKDKDFNKAWGLLHEQKSYYMQHANREGFSAQNALSLDSNVHENLANILRIEGKHHDAFFHILYWVIASYHRPIKKHQQKLQAYFNRCKFKNMTIDELNCYIEKQSHSLVDAVKIKNQVTEWLSKE